MRNRNDHATVDYRPSFPSAPMSTLTETFVRTALRVLESSTFNERPSCVFSLCFLSDTGTLSEYGVFIHSREDTSGITHLSMMDWYDCDHWMMRDLKSGSVEPGHIVYTKSTAETSTQQAAETLIRELFASLEALPVYGKGLV